MAKLTLHITNPEDLDQRTMNARYDHLVMSRWIGYCQAWRWKGGDAIVVTTGRCGSDVRSWAAIRTGNKVECMDITGYGIRGFLVDRGFEIEVA